MLPLAQQTSGRSFQFKPEAFLEGVPLALLGIFVVFAALVLISTFIALLPRAVEIVHRIRAYVEKRQLAKTAAESKAPPTGDELPEEILVVIAAAVAEVLDRPHRIIHARELTPDDIAWSLEGRMQHHASHRVTRKNPN